jgi:hypothetical protein
MWYNRDRTNQGDNVIQINNKKELSAYIDSLKGNAQMLNDQFQEIAQANRKVRIERWKQAGGCQKCRGRGKYVTWDTLDSMTGCYAEFGACEDCTVESRLVGAAPDNVGKYDRVGGTAAKVEAAVREWQTYEERIQQEEAARKSGEAWKEIEGLRDAFRIHHSPDNNKEMVVTRKWKHILKGMTGRVFWQRDNRVGLRIGDERDGRGYWKNTFFCNESQLGNTKPFMV